MLDPLITHEKHPSNWSKITHLLVFIFYQPLISCILTKLRKLKLLFGERNIFLYCLYKFIQWWKISFISYITTSNGPDVSTIKILFKIMYNVYFLWWLLYNVEQKCRNKINTHNSFLLVFKKWIPSNAHGHTIYRSVVYRNPTEIDSSRNLI